MKDLKFISPFKKLCITIGNLPTAYIESMSYYEGLTFLVNYLANNVIPAVNNNSEVVKELQDQFVILKNYVDNYFNNLDVQEEINNKLDDMADSGELTDIIAQYLGLAGMIVFNTVADMKAAENLVNGSKCQTLGFYNVNDGGGAIYEVRTLINTDVIDESTLIALNDITLVAELIIYDNINVLKCGAKNDGSEDCSTLINNLITKYANANIYFPHGDYLIENTIYLDTATKLYGENQWNSRIFTNSNIVMIENKNDDIASCFVSNLYIDGNNYATKGIYLYRENTNLVYNDSRTYLNNLDIKKCTNWCLQIGDPGTGSNVIELVANNIYVHEYTGGGIYISRCSDSHFSNLRSGSGLASTKPAIQVEGYNLQIINSKAFLAGKTDNEFSGWKFNGGANIYAEIEAQANTKHGVEIINTKDSIFNIIADKNSVDNEDYAAILIDSVQNCIVNGIVSNNVVAAGFSTTTGCKLIEPKKLTLNLTCNNDITRALDLSEYNTNQVLTVNSKININGYEKQDITPVFNVNPTLPAGITLTKINDDSYLLSGSVASDSNIWIAGSYGSHTAISYLSEDRIYELNTNNFKVGMVLYNYVTNLGGGYNRKINGSNNDVTGIMIQLKANVSYNHIISPKLISILNKANDGI